jgi:hypothetical protein
MAEKCQIIPKTVFASCETYNCLKPVAWAIGRPDGPPQKLVYFCDQCVRDMVGSIPAELLPKDESVPIREVPQPLPDAKPDTEPDKIYYCKYCGEEFDTPVKIATHTRLCPARKEIENIEKEEG